MEFFLI